MQKKAQWMSRWDNLGIQTDENLNWKIHVDDLTSKFYSTRTVLGKLRHFANNEILRSSSFELRMYRFWACKIPST